MLLRARIVVPISQPPIADGFVRVDGNCIIEVGTWADVKNKSEAVDLGEVVLLPGLVNAHCHLDYTDFVGAIPPPRSFTDWINSIVDLKKDVDDPAHRESWLHGAAQCLRHGTTTLGNIETRPDLLPELWAATPLRVASFLEMIVTRAQSDTAQAVADATNWIASHKPPRGHAGLSPHAPYTTNPDLLEACAATDLPMAMHLAESAEEDEMFRQGSGPLYERLAVAGRQMADCGSGSPIAHAHRSGLLSENLLAIHGNYLDDDDIHLLAENHVSLVHCPRSHAYFGHAPFRAEALRTAGVNLCLGTDSLATMCAGDAELNLFEELRAYCEAFPDSADLETLLQCVTVNPARAMGMAGQVGELTVDAFADLMTLPFAGPIEFAMEAIVNHTGPAQRVMLYGKWEVSCEND
ncbi:MAG: amidohydrolase family protein [Verrucomicrobiales bacterium]|nr:amidohydrolase family protein [Verrucomicrobiales bacterium]